MSLYYAGVALGQIPDDLATWWQLYLPTSDIQNSWEAGWSTGSLQDIPLPPPRSPNNDIILNTLYWPTGVSRWAKFFGIVTSSQLSAIQAATADNTPATLLVGDGVNTPLTASMYLQTVYPVSKIGNLPATEEQLYLISLVDIRYFYWEKTGVVSRVDTWTHWFTDALEIISPGSGSSAPSVNSAYKEPLYNLYMERKPLPIVIDAVARMLGYRIVVTFLGAIRFVVWQDALTAVTAFRTNHVLGKVAGEFIATADLTRDVPATFSALFKSTDNIYTEFTKTLASLAITEYNGYSGASGNKNVYYSHYIYVNNASYNTNCQALCNQAALDWYGWQLMPAEMTYWGIIGTSFSYDTLAAVDCIVFQHTGTILTKLIREPFWVTPANTEDTTKEQQLVRIPTSPTISSSGDYLGFIQQYDYIHNTWVDSTYSVWLRCSNGNQGLLWNSKYSAKFYYYPFELYDLYSCTPSLKCHGVLDTTLVYNGTATMSVWYNTGSEADTGQNITVYDWLLSSGQTVEYGIRVTAFYDTESNKWYLDGAQCIT